MPAKKGYVLLSKTTDIRKPFENYEDAQKYILAQHNTDLYIAPESVPMNNFKSSHWSEPNVVAHARIDDRIIPSPNANKFNEDYQKWIDGNKKGKEPNPKDYGKNQRILFVEEFQSDWALEGKKKGFIKRELRKKIRTKLLKNIRSIIR